MGGRLQLRWEGTSHGEWHRCHHLLGGRDSVYLIHCIPQCPAWCPLECELLEGGRSAKICSMSMDLLKVLQLSWSGGAAGTGRVSRPLQWWQPLGQGFLGASPDSLSQTSAWDTELSS